MKKVCFDPDSFPDESIVNVTIINMKNLLLKMLLYVASFSSSESDIPLVYVIIEPYSRGTAIVRLKLWAAGFVGDDRVELRGALREELDDTVWCQY